jgi:hypothetical protein
LLPALNSGPDSFSAFRASFPAPHRSVFSAAFEISLGWFQEHETSHSEF